MHALTAPLSELAEIEEICEERGREPGMLLLSGCVTSQKTHLMYALGKDYGQDFWMRLILMHTGVHRMTVHI